MFSSIFENRKKPGPQSECLTDVSDRVTKQQMLWTLESGTRKQCHLLPAPAQKMGEDPLLSLRLVDHGFFMAAPELSSSGERMRLRCRNTHYPVETVSDLCVM